MARMGPEDRAAVDHGQPIPGIAKSSLSAGYFRKPFETADSCGLHRQG